MMDADLVGGVGALVDLLAAQGVIVSRETVRLWPNRFGRHFADCIRRDRPRPNDKWHMDEVAIMIRGKKHWLWRAINAYGDVLDILVQTRRNAKAARRFLQLLVARFGEPSVVIAPSRKITFAMHCQPKGKLRNYIKPIQTLTMDADYRALVATNSLQPHTATLAQMRSPLGQLLSRNGGMIYPSPILHNL